MSNWATYFDLRSKGFAARQALQAADIDVVRGILFTLAFIAVLALAGWLEARFEARVQAAVAPYKAQAAENLHAFNLAMQGRPILVENEWKALMTCKAQEVKL